MNPSAIMELGFLDSDLGAILLTFSWVQILARSLAI